MADHRLAPLTAFGRREALYEILGPLTLTENTRIALASLAPRRGREAEAQAIAARIGLPLPAPGTSAEGPVWQAFWLAPGHWMVGADLATHEDIAAMLLAVFGDTVSVTEQTDAWVRLDLAAPDLPGLFERLCNVDLAALPPNSATRTVIEHLGCYLLTRADGITLYGPRSSAASLHHAIATAARSL